MRKRIKSLTAIAKIRDRDLQERSTELSHMRADLRRIVTVRETLDKARREECRVSLPEALPYVASYLHAIGAEDERAARAQQVMTGLIETKHEEVLDAWRSLRSIEQVRGEVVETLRRSESRAQAAETDERNIISYQRARRQAA